MVKHYILAIVIFLLLVDVANTTEIYNKGSSKLDLYGKAAGLHLFSKDTNSGNLAYGHLGLKGETKIQDYLIGYGRWEYSFAGNNFENNLDSNSNNKASIAYVGLKAGNYGSLDYGRNYGIVYDALNYTNMLPAFGGDTIYSDNFFVGRVNGVATYRNSNFFGLVNGLNLGIQYLGKNEWINNYTINTYTPGKSNNIHKSNGDGWGTSISYESNGFSIVGAYGIADRINAQQDYYRMGNNEKVKQWASGLKYDANNIYLATNYGETRNSTPTNKGFANKTKDIILVAQYQFDCNLRPSIAYVQSREKDVKSIGDKDLVKYIELGATYYFNKNISTYIDYKINQIYNNNKLDINSKDTVALGVTYKF